MLASFAESGCGRTPRRWHCRPHGRIHSQTSTCSYDGRVTRAYDIDRTHHISWVCLGASTLEVGLLNPDLRIREAPGIWAC